jgi:hypothetical protein
MALSGATAGVTSPICDADYATVFDAVVAAVTTGALPCTIPLEGAPDGATPDPSRVSVTYEGATSFVQGVACQGEGWRFDDPLAPTAIQACPATCERLAADSNGLVEVAVGCFLD